MHPGAQDVGDREGCSSVVHRGKGPGALGRPLCRKTPGPCRPVGGGVTWGASHGRASPGLSISLRISTLVVQGFRGDPVGPSFPYRRAKLPRTQVSPIPP